jgi:hypothetical protein
LKKDLKGDVYQHWFEKLSLLSEEDDQIVLRVPNDFDVI